MDWDRASQSNALNTKSCGMAMDSVGRSSIMPVTTFLLFKSIQPTSSFLPPSNAICLHCSLSHLLSCLSILDDGGNWLASQRWIKKVWPRVPQSRKLAYKESRQAIWYANETREQLTSIQSARVYPPYWTPTRMHGEEWYGWSCLAGMDT